MGKIMSSWTLLCVWGYCHVEPGKGLPHISVTMLEAHPFINRTAYPFEGWRETWANPHTPLTIMMYTRMTECYRGHVRQN